jgi:hypothetical protein
MATRGIVAHATTNGWRGRYVHWDNYPQRIVGVLGELVARDGRANVAHKLCYEYASWSSLDPKASKNNENSLYEQHETVDGYGYAHTDTELTDPSAWFTQEDTELAWCEWLYIIHETMLEVRRITRNDKGEDITVYHTSFPWESIAITEVTA